MEVLGEAVTLICDERRTTTTAAAATPCRDFTGSSMGDAVEQSLGVARMSESVKVSVRNDVPINVSIFIVWWGEHM